MTRFARAKGSKASNEKKPEEATPWVKMKNSMLSKFSKQPEESFVKEKKISDAPVKTQWAELDKSLSLLPKKTKASDRKPIAAKSREQDDDNNGEEHQGKRKKKKKKELSEGESKPLKSDFSMKKVDGNKTPKQKKRKSSEKISENESPPKKIKKQLADADDVQDDRAIVKKKFKKLNKSDKKNLKLSEKKDFKKSANNSFGGFSDMKNKNSNFRYNKNRFEDKFRNKKNYMRNNKFEYQDFNNKSGGFEEEIIVNGEKIKIVKFQGFCVTQDDAERLKKLRATMIKEGIPRDKLEAAIKLERRRAEKALSRLKKAVCFHCRGSGHLLSNCPVLAEKQESSTGICYKCGSTEHSAFECKVVKGMNFQYAECFICKDQGHIARQCPDNPRGLYPQGGACRECGDVTHLRKDCPQVMSKKTEEIVTVGLRNDRNLECLDEEIASKSIPKVNKVNKKKSIKF